MLLITIIKIYKVYTQHIVLQLTESSNVQYLHLLPPVVLSLKIFLSGDLNSWPIHDRLKEEAAEKAERKL